MNTKIRKVLTEIEQTEAKIVSLQSRAKSLHEEKAKLEDLEIVHRFRSIKVDTYNIEEYVDTLKKLKNGEFAKLDNKNWNSENLNNKSLDVAEEMFNEEF